MISLILAAGKGTRMKSDKPKVLHEVNGVPMLKRVANVLENIGIKNNVFILGHKKEELHNHNFHHKNSFSFHLKFFLLIKEYLHMLLKHLL